MCYSGSDIVVTGVGAVTAAGCGVDALWQGVLRGEGTGRTIEQFETADLPARIASQVPGFDPADHLPRKMLRRTERYVQLGLVAGEEAWTDAALENARPTDERIAVFVGTASGGTPYAEAAAPAFLASGFSVVSPWTAERLCANSLAGALSIRHRTLGASATLTTSCAASAYALRQARDEILLNRADVALVVGADAAVTRGTLAAFAAAGVLSRRNDDPARAARPFDAQRDGFVLGEGAGALILERGDRARARGAKIYGVLAGIGASSDAFHPLACLADGSGAARAIRQALCEGDFTPGDVGYVNAHGTATKLNDAAETAAIRSALGDRAARVAVSSTKPVTGHTIGASSAIEAVIAALAVHHRQAPPTANLEHRDDACDLDYVPGCPRPLRAPVALSNSLGFGGANVTVALAAA